MSATTTILHPTDFSAHADHAFALACSLARASGSRLLVLHVAPIPQLHTKRYYREEMEAALPRRQRPTRPYREKLLKNIPKSRYNEYSVLCFKSRLLFDLPCLLPR